MTGWQKHTGQMIALGLENVDTDQLIPARFMSRPRDAGYGDYLLHDLRRRSGGDLDPAFPLNRWAGASILVAGRNFGCGSSREAAVYALVDAGIKVVIAPGFGDIFVGNAVNNGLLPARMAEADVAALIASAPVQAHVDPGACSVRAGSATLHFQLAEAARTKLLNGWDDVDLTGLEEARILAFRKTLQHARPWVWPSTHAAGGPPGQ